MPTPPLSCLRDFGPQPRGPDEGGQRAASTPGGFSPPSWFILSLGTGGGGQASPGTQGVTSGPQVHTGQGQARSRAMGWGSHQDQASWGLLGSTSLPSPPHSATQGAQTRQDPHLGPHTAAGLARLKLELCPPVPPGPLPLPGLPEWFDSLWGHPSLPHPRAHERWAGSKHRTAMPSAVGSPGDAGTLRGLPLHEASTAPEAARSRNGALAGACGAAGQDSRREGARPDSTPQMQCRHWPRRPAGSRPHHPPWQAAWGQCADPPARPRIAPVASQVTPARTALPKTGLGTPAGRRDWSPPPRTFRNFSRLWAQLGCPRTADPPQPPRGRVWPKSHCL